VSQKRTHCYDVAVIGAGPAGSSAALAAVRAGYSVVLFEKARLPRYKACGGGVLARAYHRLPASAAGIVERSFNSVALNFPGAGMNLVATRPEPLVYMTMRSALDHCLAVEAQTAGVELIEACPVSELDQARDAVRISAGGDRFRAGFVIAADGVHSRVARAAGWPALPTLAPALEYEVHLAENEFAQYSQRPRFDFDVIDAGYGWVFPKRDHLSAGILSTLPVCSDLPAKLADYLRGIGISRIQKIERHGYLIPLAPRRGPLARGRVLLAGDAAGLVDPVTAEGISHALLSGQLAAAALTEGRLDPPTVAANYQSLLARHILGELRAARFLARFLYHHPKIRHGAFRLRGQQLCDFAAKVVMGEASYREALARPATYSKMLGW